MVRRPAHRGPWPEPRRQDFTTLAPGTEVVAREILADTGPAPNLAITVDEISRALVAR
jgi:hypothetical protein